MSDDELGMPEGHEGSTNLNAQINHLIASFTDNISALHWKVSQHASQIDGLVLRLGEKESEAEALSQALESEMNHSEKLEKENDELRRGVTEGRADAFLDVGTIGWPVVVPEVGDDESPTVEQSVEPSDSTASPQAQ
jgi:hypothetical protein